MDGWGNGKTKKNRKIGGWMGKWENRWIDGGGQGCFCIYTKNTHTQVFANWMWEWWGWMGMDGVN